MGEVFAAARVMALTGVMSFLAAVAFEIIRVALSSHRRAKWRKDHHGEGLRQILKGALE